jgi:hypothetical protein
MSIENLLSIDVSARTEKKANLTYLSWAWAWDFALRADPTAVYEIKLFDGKPFVDINGTAMVMVAVTMFGKTMTCQLPVMDHRNKAITKPDAFQVNTSIMRCMTKGLALHGLGLNIYVGEDLQEYTKPKGDAPIITPKSGIGDDMSDGEKDFLRDMAQSCKDLVSEGKALNAYNMIKDAALEQDHEVWLADQMDAATRSAIKKAKPIN